MTDEILQIGSGSCIICKSELVLFASLDRTNHRDYWGREDNQMKKSCRFMLLFSKMSLENLSFACDENDTNTTEEPQALAGNCGSKSLLHGGNFSLILGF